MEQIIEEAANVIWIRSTIPDISELAEEAGCSRQTLYNRARQFLIDTKGGDSAKSTPDIVNNPATAQRDEALTAQVYPVATKSHLGGGK